MLQLILVKWVHVVLAVPFPCIRGSRRAVDLARSVGSQDKNICFQDTFAPVANRLLLQHEESRNSQGFYGQGYGSAPVLPRSRVCGALPGGVTWRAHPNLSQCVELWAQTVQSLPNDDLSSQQLTSEPERNHPFAKPLYELKLVPGVRIPPSPPELSP